MAQQRQGPDANQKNSQPVLSITQSPVKASSQETAPAASAAGQDTGPARQQQAKVSKGVTEENKSGDESKDKLLGNSLEAVIIAGALIGVLGYLFYIQLSYSRKLDQTTYLGKVFRDSVLQFELGRLTAPFREKWDKGGYVQDAVMNERPPKLDGELEQLDREIGYEKLQDLRDATMNRLLRFAWGASTAPPGLYSSSDYAAKSSLSEKTDDLPQMRYKNLAASFRTSLKDWEDRTMMNARQAYQNDQYHARIEAEKNTENAVDTTEASLLRGQGPKFVLEFTALIVIIFLAVILGVLGRLDSQQIGTLLAAIAGYVLGKATTSQAPAQAPAAQVPAQATPQAPTQAPASPAPKAEDQGRASGRAA